MDDAIKSVLIDVRRIAVICFSPFSRLGELSCCIARRAWARAGAFVARPDTLPAAAQKPPVKGLAGAS
jgi:hypothetical protein